MLRSTTDHDELSLGGNAIDEDVDDIRAGRRDRSVGRHLDGDGLAGSSGVEASGIEPNHTVTHVDGVGDETTIVERDLDSLGVGRVVELDGEGLAVSLEGAAGQSDSGRTSWVANEIRRSVDLVTELSQEWDTWASSDDRLLDGVGTRDEKGTIKEEESDGVVKTRNGGAGTGSPSLTLGLSVVVDEDIKGGVAGNLETLSTLVGTVDPDGSTVGKESSLDHTTALGHAVHLPGSVGVKGLYATARGISRRSDVLVSTTTADNNVRVVVVSAGKREEDGATGVGVGSVITGKVREDTDNGVGVHVEDFR